MYHTKCSIEYCERYVFGRGFCSKHYQRLRTHGNPTYLKIAPRYYMRYAIIKVVKGCSVEGCDSEIEAKRLCLKHYTRLRKHGDVNTVLKVVGEDRYKHPLYKLFYGMHDRCRNPNNTHYSYYGGRGITVCERWSGAQGFSNFIADMGERPDKYTLDRIDNNKGYQPDNCRWASRTKQIENTRTPVTNTSGMKGVHLYKKSGRWTAFIQIDRKRKHLGYFDTKEQAWSARLEAQEKKNIN